MRNQLMDALTDADLQFDLGGDTLKLGVLCRELGEVQHAYAASFTSFKLQFTPGSADPTLETSMAGLKAWYAELDRQLEAAITALSDDVIQNQTIERGWEIPIAVNLEVYKEALLIFYGKVSIYFRAMRKPRLQQVADWIA